MNLRQIKIGQRLALVFAVQVVLLLGVAFSANASFASLSARMRQITMVNNAEAELAVAMRAAISYRMIALRNLVLFKDEAEARQEAATIGVLNRKYEEAARQLQTLLDGHPTMAQLRAAVEEAGTLARDAAPLMEAVVQERFAGRTEEAEQVLMDRLRPIQGRWSAALTRLGEIKAGENAVLLDETQALERRERTLMLAVPALAILAAALLGWRITRSITHPLAEAVALAQTVAAGNLAITAYSAGRDEPAQLTRALNDMATSLRSAIGTVHGGAQAIRIASAEIAEGNLDLSGRTENQASALEETAAAMEELTSTVQHNAANAERASGLAHSTADLAVRGGEEVGQMVSTMDDIDQAAHRITDITSVIDDIAFQTNLLALNAAVEAARAGEQGRGFAVVAGEVRNLAQRCAGAAREIKNLIGGTVTRVEDGVRLAGNAGATMTKVVDGIREVSTIMADISRAGKEQSIGIGQVNEAIASMDTVTQQNAALVEQASAAAASLRKEADQLATVVALFRLEAGATTIVAHRADARALLAPAAHGSAA